MATHKTTWGRSGEGEVTGDDARLGLVTGGEQATGALLAGYRAQVEKAWTPQTAHPRYTGLTGMPYGQCGVTSAWLQKRLREDHHIESAFCIGEVTGHDRYLDHHCWLEVDGQVVDLTVDQMWPGDPFVGAALTYRPRWRLEATDDRLRDRLRLLEAGL